MRWLGNERRLGGGRQFAASGGCDDALRRRACAIRARSAAGGDIRLRAGQWRVRLRAQARRRPAGGPGRCEPRRVRPCGADAGRARDTVSEPRLADRFASAWQELRGLRRGPAAAGSGKRGAGGLRQHRAAEALLDPRDGPEPGQALEHERPAGAGAPDRAVAPAGWNHDGAGVFPSGVDGAPGRTRIRARAAHPAARASRAPRGAVDAGRRLDAPGVLPDRWPLARAVHPERGPARAQRGRQAAEFLERVYTGRYARMKIGSTRYAVMCDEAGVLVDEGVVARLAEDHFYFTTTTS